jgi:quercetin dioxygenase-like cupin family protein
MGQEIVYPAGKPNITAAVVTIQPQESTGWHLHDAPLFAMILDGELTVDYGNGVIRHELPCLTSAPMEQFCEIA